MLKLILSPFSGYLAKRVIIHPSFNHEVEETLQYRRTFCTYGDMRLTTSHATASNARIPLQRIVTEILLSGHQGQAAGTERT